MKSAYLPNDLAGQLAHVVEESTEVVKAITKAQRFGLSNRWPPGAPTTNAETIVEEMNDLVRAIEVVRPALSDAIVRGRAKPRTIIVEGPLSPDAYAAMRDAKYEFSEPSVLSDMQDPDGPETDEAPEKPDLETLLLTSQQRLRAQLPVHINDGRWLIRVVIAALTVGVLALLVLLAVIVW